MAYKIHNLKVETVNQLLRNLEFMPHLQNKQKNNVVLLFNSNLVKSAREEADDNTWLYEFFRP